MAVLGLTSCEKEPSKAIVGTWEAVKMEVSISGINMTVDFAQTGMRMEFTFNADDTGSMLVESEGESDRATFEYTVNDNILSLSGEGGTEGIPVSFDKKTMVLEMNGDILGEPGSNVKIYFEKK